MKTAGVYMHKRTGIIWLCEKVEYYEGSTFEDGIDRSIIVCGSVGGYMNINRCLVTKDQYKMFYRIGSL